MEPRELTDNRAIVFELAKRELEIMIAREERPMLSWAMNPIVGAFAVAKATFDNTNQVIDSIKTGTQDWGHKFIFSFLGLNHDQAMNIPFVFGHIFWRNGPIVNWLMGKNIHIDFDPTRGRISMPKDFIQVGKFMLDFVSPDAFVHIPKEDYNNRGETLSLKGISKLSQLANFKINS